MRTARIRFEVATVPFIVAGGAHALAALFGVRRPTLFDPTRGKTCEPKWRSRASGCEQCLPAGTPAVPACLTVK